MPLISSTDLVGSVRQYQILEAEQVSEMEGNLAARFPDPKALARELVLRGWLTSYQVNQLFRDKAGELVLGSYVLLEPIGEGGMGQVFKARHRTLDRRCALKVIHKERLANPEVVQRFLARPERPRSCRTPTS